LETLVERLGGVEPWGVVGGWSIDLHLGRQTRHHGDLEIAVPQQSFGLVAAAVTDLEWDVVGDGHLWPYPEALDDFPQTWLRDPTSGSFLLDVIRESHDDATWRYRRDPTITVPYVEAYLRTEHGLRYLAPELAVLFKAKHQRPKDEQDFVAVLPAMNEQQRHRLRTWLERTEPGHAWLKAL
jgi:hypothetical protein